MTEEYVETKNSYIKRALDNLRNELGLLEYEGQSCHNISVAIEYLETALVIPDRPVIVPYSSPDSSADASKPDTE